MIGAGGTPTLHAARASRPCPTSLQLSWKQNEPLFRLRLDGFATIQQRKILTLCPQRQQVAIVLTPRLARLAWNIYRHRFVPVRQIQYLSERCSVSLRETRA